MTDTTAQEKKEGESENNVKNDGVSFKGESLVLTTEKDCDKVVEAINTCKDLQYLNLEGNTLGVEGSKAISKALEKKSELKRALWMDMFTGRLKEEIPKALEILGNGLTLAGAQLTELDLSDNAFGPIGVKGLAGLLSSRACYQLTVLKLNNNGLGSSGGKILADALLQCHKNSKNEGKPLQLKLFVAGRNRLENAGAIELARVFQTLGTLEGIIMPQNSIFHKGIKALSDSLKNNHNLKVLDLNDNILTIKGAKHIAKVLPYLQHLTVLNLGDCLLKTGGATVLANALSDKHEHLEELHLSCNEIRSDGGLALVEAMTNKNKLKSFNVSGNLFGTAGRKLLKEGLENNKRIETLSNLSDDESCSENESNSEEENEDNSDEESNEENGEPESEEEEKERNGLSPGQENPKSEGINNLDSLSQALSSLSVKPSPVGPLKTFLENPILENFLPVTEEKINEFLKNNQDFSAEFYLDTFISVLVKISSLSSCRKEEVEKLSLKISGNMYRDLFTWASDKNHLSTVNNTLFVHLGLIKSEDKNFKINWDTKGSLSALKAATMQGCVPAVTQEIFKCLLEKEETKQHPEEISLG